MLNQIYLLHAFFNIGGFCQHFFSFFAGRFDQQGGGNPLFIYQVGKLDLRQRSLAAVFIYGHFQPFKTLCGGQMPAGCFPQRLFQFAVINLAIKLIKNAAQCRKKAGAVS